MSKELERAILTPPIDTSTKTVLKYYNEEWIIPARGIALIQAVCAERDKLVSERLILAPAKGEDQP